MEREPTAKLRHVYKQQQPLIIIAHYSQEVRILQAKYTVSISETWVSPRNHIVYTSTGTRMAPAWNKSTLTSDLIIDNTGPW